jgi:hypothetical protein
MKKRTKAFLTGVVIAAFVLACFAKTPSLSGKMVAYDLLAHSAKVGSFEANKEIVILETPGQKNKYVKVVFVSYGTIQIDGKYFDGTLPLTVKALRDHACDEKYPRMASQYSPSQSSGTYLLTDAFKSSPPARIKNLVCYDAIEKK